MSKVLRALVWLLPAGATKNRLLKLVGNALGVGVVVGPCLVLGCAAFVLEDNTIIAPFNVFRGLREVRLESGAQIGSWNWISAHPDYQQLFGGAGSLVVGKDAYITSRHYLDASGSITLGAMSALAGQRSTLQTHEMNLVENRTSVGTISIGERAFVGTGCILLRGAAVPPKSLLAAGSTLTKTRESDTELPQGLWAGTPAKFIKPMPGKWFDRDEAHVAVSYADDGLR